MFTIEIAGITVRIYNQYPYVHRLCRNYLVEYDQKPALEIRVTNEEIAKQMEATEIPTTPGYSEGVCAYRNICEQLPTLFEAYLLHGAVI